MRLDAQYCSVACRDRAYARRFLEDMAEWGRALKTVGLADRAFLDPADADHAVIETLYHLRARKGAKRRSGTARPPPTREP